MHSAVMDGDEGGGRETFVELGVLVVEGRVPGPGARGYAEGPHCVRATPSTGAGLQRHDCDTGFACVRAGQLRQHMSLLWENRVPVCVEVLLCPACPCGRAKAQCPDIVRLPAPSDLLLEQWTISCSTKKSGEPTAPGMGARGLVQAVRSQLHFSQLSAWWSSSRGASPANVTYRVTVPGEAFASQFRHSAPVTHTFPPAAIAGGASIRVSVRTAPRMESVPALLCTVHHEPTAPAAAPAPDEAPSHSDKLLGACLLDPPPSLEHRRFASPPRGVSPVVDAPRSLRRENSPPSPPLSLQHRRLGREGLARRRDSSWKAASAPMVDDRMLNPCNRAGKHDCRCDEDAEPPPGGQCAGEKLAAAKECYRAAKDAAGPSRAPAKECFAATAAEGFAGRDGCGSRCVSPGCAAAEGCAAPKDGCRTAKVCFASSATTKESCKEGYSTGKEGYAEGKEKQRKRVKKEAEGCGSDGKAKLNLELSPQEFEEVLSVLRERNPSQPHHGTKSLSRSPDDQTCSRLAACKVQCFPAASSSSSVAGAKAAPFLDAILRTSGRAVPDLAADLAAEISKLSVEPGLHSGTKRKRFQPKCAFDGAAVTSPSSRRKHRHEPLCLSPTNIDERTLSSAPRAHKTNKAISDLVLSEKVPCDFGATSSVRRESVMGGGDDAVGDIVGAGAFESGTEKVAAKAEDENRAVPSASDKEKFRRSLDFAASMVFHSRTGLPLTSSPAPVRRNATCFDYDSSITSVSAIRSALFETSTEETLSSDEAESEGRSPCSPRVPFAAVRCAWSRYTHLASSLLGTFEESVLNGRLEPVSTVQGFTANLGASGSFCPRHVALPVTVFFYTLGDNDKVSTPYLAHINLGKKGYNVPRCGTIQVTLFNPLGTVVKMFVVMYDLTDMPANSQTFLRQRTLYMPANAATSRQPGDFQKWLRYLVHLRFSSSKSGRVYLHSDIRMIVFRKSDLDTATAHGVDMSYELRSFTQGPTNPKFSSRN